MSFLGIPDPAVWIAYLGVIVAAIGCVIYGAINWNKGGDLTPEEEAQEKAWGKEEKEIEDELTEGGAK